ncbi:MAG: spore germination protein [Candidatus Pristimantibacillus lignocellulolyticus]|uniref:Spore germination protein n=1 Tax=Candidatus Pristimantibacillus lignocellulolyticus TaxID=2994561 RepID=A0A9J6ZD90_9BACL|nr:MAG: spore germination protein [Candidatus Pristimantibacillus lignocellulolyticus]
MFVTKDDRISANQAMASMTCTTLGAGLLVMPRILIQDVGTPDVWLTLLLTGILVVLALIFFIKLSQKFPEQTLYQYSSKILGRPLGNLVCLLFSLYLLLTSAYELRILAEVIVFYLLEGTPKWAIVIPFMLVSYYLLLGGVNAMMRLFQIVLPITIIIIIIVYGLSFSMFHIDNLKPVFGSGISPVFNGSIHSFNSFAGYELVAIYFAYMNEPKKAIKSFAIGLGLVVVIYLIALILVIGSLSLEAGMLSTWPTIDLVRNYELKGFFFERIEILFLVIWVMQLFCAFSSMYYGASLGLSHVLGNKKRPILLGLLPVSYIFTMVPRNINDITVLGYVISYYCILLFIIALILFIVYSFRKRVISHV